MKVNTGFRCYDLKYCTVVGLVYSDGYVLPLEREDMECVHISSLNRNILN